MLQQLYLKYIIAFSTCIVLIFFASECVAESVQSIYQDSRDSVVTILLYGVGEQDPQKLTSGFYVRDNIVVTAYHSIHNAADIEVKKSYNQSSINCRVLSKDKKSDIALLEVEESAEPLPLARGGIVTGDSIIVISSPHGLEKTISKGIISGLRKKDDIALCQITASISPGSSGGPIINSRGEVVGMVSFMLSTQHSQNLNFGIVADSIRSLLKKGDGSSQSLQMKTGEEGEIVISD